MARTDEEKEALKVFLRERLLIVWRGQVDDWEDGVNWIANKTGYSVEFFEKTIIPYLCDWNRQKDLADAKGKFMAELPNIGPFIRKQKYKNPLPYQFTELKAGIHDSTGLEKPIKTGSRQSPKNNYSTICVDRFTSEQERKLVWYRIKDWSPDLAGFLSSIGKTFGKPEKTRIKWKG